MSLKNVLNAQKSGELDLMPGSAFNEICPLTIRDDDVYVMFQGEEWYYSILNRHLIDEAIELNDINKTRILIENNVVYQLPDRKKLFTGESIQDLFAEIVSEAGILIEFG